MAEAKKNAVVRLLAAHGEKIALGAASLLLAGYLVASVALGGPDPGAQQLESLASSILEETRKEHQDLGPGRAATLAIPTLQTYSPNTPAIAGDPWAGSYATEIVLTENVREEAPRRQKLIPSVSVAGAVPELGAITIRFDVRPVDPAANDEAPISKFRVERRLKSAADFAAIAQLPANARSYKDATVEPKKDYLYRVVPLTEEKQVKNVDPKGAGKPSNEIAVTSLGIWKFTVLMPTPDPNEEGRGKAFLQIEKYDQKTGLTVKEAKIHPEGGRIGFWDGTFLHRVSLPDGRSIEVDFDCGAVLKSIENVEIRLRWRKCVKKFDEKGGWIGCDIVSDETTEQTFSRVKVVILDEEKRPIVIHHPDYPAQPADQTCEKHREAPKEPK